MHDFTLGPPVDVGCYDGPLLNGEPIHRGNCEDGVYGCRHCNEAARCLSDADRDAIGWPATATCDWCRKVVPADAIYGLRPWDEPSCYYEVCSSCRRADRLDAEAALGSYDDD